MNRWLHRSLTLLIAVSVFALPLAWSIAEDAKKPDPKTKPAKVTGIYGKLDLSDEQKVQIKEVQKDTAAKIKALREEEAEKIMALLTDAQKQQLEAIQEQQKAEKKEKAEEAKKVKDKAGDKDQE